MHRNGKRQQKLQISLIHLVILAWRYNSYLDLLPDIEAVCLSFYHWHHHNTWQFSQSCQAMSNPLQSLPADYLFPFSLLESHIYSHICKQANEFKLTSHEVTKDKNSCSQMTWNFKKTHFQMTQRNNKKSVSLLRWPGTDSSKEGKRKGQNRIYNLNVGVAQWLVSCHCVLS